MAMLHLVRHAPVIGQEGILYGDDADISFNDVQDELNFLAQELPAPGKAKWFSSGVYRAHQSALEVLRRKDITDFDPPYHAQFKEQDFGSLTGKKHEEIKEHIQSFDRKIVCFNPPGGEAITDIISRVFDAFKDLSLKATTDYVIFTHGGVIRAAYCAYEGKPKEYFLEKQTPHLSLHSFDLSVIKTA